MVKIAFFAPWWTNCEQANSVLFNQTPGNKGVWGNLQGVCEYDNPDYYVILQEDTNTTIDIDKHKKIYLQREPSAIQSERKFLSQQGIYSASYNTDYQFAIWRIEKTYDELKELQYPIKGKNLSTVLSHKRITSGQKKRTDFIYKFLQKYPEDIDVLGSFQYIYPYLKKASQSKFWNFLYSIFPRFIISSNYVDLSKFDAIYSYRYSFCAENCKRKNYFTEKIIDAYLGWSVPIYWGTPNILDFFPEDSLHEIDIESEASIERLHKISLQPVTEKTIRALTRARELILDEYNIWPALHKMINSL